MDRRKSAFYSRYRLCQENLHAPHHLGIPRVCVLWVKRGRNSLGTGRRGGDYNCCLEMVVTHMPNRIHFFGRHGSQTMRPTLIVPVADVIHPVTRHYVGLACICLPDAVRW